jgi:hypothetical protein
MLLLTHVPLRAVPDPLELQKVAEEIRQSVSRRIESPGNEETKLAIWDIADALPADSLKQFFPKGCRIFKAKGSFTEYDGVNVVRTWFTYADCHFLCVFLSTFSNPSPKKIVLFEDSATDERILWTLDF